MDKDKWGVHEAHCCVLHGCKYMDEDCPVKREKVEQKYLCEECDEDGIETLEDLRKSLEYNKNHKEDKEIDVEICPYCEDRSIKELINRSAFFDTLWCHNCEGGYKIVYKRVPVDVKSFHLLDQKYKSQKINVTLINNGHVPNTLDFK